MKSPDELKNKMLTDLQDMQRMCDDLVSVSLDDPKHAFNYAKLLHQQTSDRIDKIEERLERLEARDQRV